MRIRFTLLALCIGVSLTSSAQKVELLAGELNQLKGQTDIAIQFVYDSMTVGKFSGEKYIENMKARWNQEEAGKGEKWETYWLEAREKRYEPVFKHFFSKESGLKTNPDAEYKLVFKTMHTEPGWNIGVKGLRSSIEAIAYVVKVDNPNQILTTFGLSKFRATDGNGGDWEAARRIQEAYLEAAKALGSLIKTQLAK